LSGTEEKKERDRQTETEIERPMERKKEGGRQKDREGGNWSPEMKSNGVDELGDNKFQVGNQI
jgi:hypothetical protein